MPGLDTKMTLTLKDLIMLIAFLGAGFGGYYSIDSRVDTVEKITLKLEQQNEVYINLPRDVETLKEDVKENSVLTKAIYIGLIAKGIIKPPQ